MLFISSKIKFLYLGCFVQLPQQYIHIYYLHKYYGNGEHFHCSFGIFSRIIFPRKNIKFTKTKLKAESNDKEKLRSSVRVSHTFSFQLVRSNFSFLFSSNFVFGGDQKSRLFLIFFKLFERYNWALFFRKNLEFTNSSSALNLHRELTKSNQRILSFLAILRTKVIIYTIYNNFLLNLKLS